MQIARGGVGERGAAFSPLTGKPAMGPGRGGVADKLPLILKPIITPDDRNFRNIVLDPRAQDIAEMWSPALGSFAYQHLMISKQLRQSTECSALYM
jgi:hypothetical protein